MKRLALGLLVILASLSVASSSRAQQPETPAEDPAGGEKAPPAEAAPAPDLLPDLDLSEIPGLEEETGTKPATAADAKKVADAAGLRRRSWEDIVVVPRKAFLKKSRVELAPFAGITLNDPLIRHYSFGLDLNYYITDVLSVGAEGQYFIKELSERESLVGLQYYLVPTLNKMKYHYALAFGYVPGYGKFGLFNKWIVHWDLTFALGAGMIRTEIIPRAFGDKSFTNDNFVGHVGLGVRLFVLDWLTLSLTFRDYMYVDVFEIKTRDDPNQFPNRQDMAAIKQASQDNQSQFVQNIMMFFSVGVYVPPSFTYRTPR
jgi:outer membrane beta-barrel protein